MVKDLQHVGGSAALDDIFLVKSREQGSGTNGKMYLNVVLADVTGTIEARKWDATEKDEQDLTPNTIVRIIGNVISYKNKTQVKIGQVLPVDVNSIDRSLYIPAAPVTLPEMVHDVKELVNSIEDSDIRAVVQGVMNDNWEAYKLYPAAVTVHQNYESGLIFHSLSVCRIALAISDLYPGTFHRDYLIAGTLLHDIGKVKELSGPVNTKYTRIGKLESHINIGAMLINQKCVELNVPQEKTDLLTHIILSHHGKPEYGSSVVPKTADAFLVHLADDADAKITVIQNYMATVNPGEFTARVPWMDGIELYRPSFDKDGDE